MVIDSNILVYSLNTSSPKNKQAQEFLQSNISIIAVAHQNMLESIRVLTHPKFSSPMSEFAALKSICTIVDQFTLIYPLNDTVHIALSLIKKYELKADRVFDAYFAATAISNGDTVVATDNDRHFRMFEEIEVINPFK